MHLGAGLAAEHGEALMVHFFGTPTEATDALEHDECCCDDDRDEEEVEVIFHVGAVETAKGWACFTCGFSTTPVDGNA